MPSSTSRTDGPGAGPTGRRRAWRCPRGAALGAGLGVAFMLTGCGGSGVPVTPHASASPSPADSYGALPSYLPTSSTQADSVLTGTAARPALTTEGDSVKVQTPQGTVLASVTGPEVPGEGLPYQSPATACTWTITLSHASAPIPITIADFTALDHLGNVYHPDLVAGQPKPAPTLPPDRTVTFELRTRMMVGEGLMRWAPGRQTILASWDFEVEND